MRLLPNGEVIDKAGKTLGYVTSPVDLYVARGLKGCALREYLKKNCDIVEEERGRNQESTRLERFA